MLIGVSHQSLRCYCKIPITRLDLNFKRDQIFASYFALCHMDAHHCHVLTRVRALTIKSGRPKCPVTVSRRRQCPTPAYQHFKLLTSPLLSASGPALPPVLLSSSVCVVLFLMK